jgi:hypothetical protein
MPLINRRQFLTLPLAALLVPSRRASAAPEVVKGTYTADVGILYDILSFTLRGTIEQSLDRTAGEYRVIAVGTGSGIANRIESQGVFRDGSWKPVRSASWFDVRGRESRTNVVYDWESRRIEFHARAETFFLRRLRTVDDVVTMPPGAQVDDVMSATLNYADGRWTPQPDGSHRTLVVRRRRTDNEGPDDVASSYRAEIVPLELKVVKDESGKTAALFDLSRFSSWANPSRPARIVFDEHRRPESITTSMILGTSVKIRFSGA